MPSKILRPFDGNRRIIDILIENIRHSCADRARIVLATTSNPSDDILEEAAACHGIDCFRGDEQDVLGRFIGAASQYGIDRLIRVCSDNPFLIADSFPEMFDCHDRLGGDYLAYSFPDGRPTIKSHLGLFSELTTTEALRRAADATDEQLYREHVTIYLYTHPEEFDIRLIPLPELLRNRTDLRLTLDTPEDFALLSELYRLHRDTTDRSLGALVALVDSDPRYGAIMKQNILQNEK